MPDQSDQVNEWELGPFLKQLGQEVCLPILHAARLLIFRFYLGFRTLWLMAFQPRLFYRALLSSDQPYDTLAELSSRLDVGFKAFPQSGHKVLGPLSLCFYSVFAYNVIVMLMEHQGTLGEKLNVALKSVEPRFMPGENSYLQILLGSIAWVLLFCGSAWLEAKLFCWLVKKDGQGHPLVYKPLLRMRLYQVVFFLIFSFWGGFFWGLAMAKFGDASPHARAVLGWVIFLVGMMFLVQVINGVHTYASVNGLSRLRVWWFAGVTSTLVNAYTFWLVWPILLLVKLVQKLRAVFSKSPSKLQTT